jgi:tetratricopeptide (TPR) repeat protein
VVPSKKATGGKRSPGLIGDEARQRLVLLAIDVGAGNPGVRTELENYLRKQPNDPAALMRLGEVQ